MFEQLQIKCKCDKAKQLARKTQQFTVKHLRAAKNITLKNIKRGKYFRLIADVYVDGISLDELLIKYKHAVAVHSIQGAIWRIFYLVKARGKGYKPDQTKNYGTSRIKPKS